MDYADESFLRFICIVHSESNAHDCILKQVSIAEHVAWPEKVVGILPFQMHPDAIGFEHWERQDIIPREACFYKL